jgi:hypothetical protein
MLFVGVVTGVVVSIWALGWIGSRAGRTPIPFRTKGAALLLTAGVCSAVSGVGVQAATVPTVQLGTAANYSVLAGSTVTNTGNSVLNSSAGLWPGTSITGFPPGLVTAPGTIDATSAAAQQAQSDLTTAYNDAAGRSIDATTAADLTNLVLLPGVYAAPNKGPLSLSGPLVLDGAGDPNSVWIFQTDSTLMTSSASTVTLINAAQACNVFWQVGSSATLGTNSVFVGNILALTSVTVTTGATVQGRALARNAAVTLDTNTFTQPLCDLSIPTTTTVAGTATTVAGSETTVQPSPTSPPVNGGGLPKVGSSDRSSMALAALAFVAIGVTAVHVARRRDTVRTP